VLEQSQYERTDSTYVLRNAGYDIMETVRLYEAL